MNEKKFDAARKLGLVFFIGAFAGFVYEVVFYYFTESRLDNPGVLYGPWLPIYGTGAALMSLLPERIKRSPAPMFFASMVLTGALEYAAGWALLKFLGLKLWDYTGLFLNIGGFVCLRSALTFAAGGLVLAFAIEPAVEKLLSGERSSKAASIALAVLAAAFAADAAISRITERTPYLY